jgi:hypothetical protein
MRVSLKEFPYKPGTMGCCKECNGKEKKDCEPNPMKCEDFCIWNNDFIREKLSELFESI